MGVTWDEDEWSTGSRREATLPIVISAASGHDLIYPGRGCH